MTIILYHDHQSLGVEAMGVDVDALREAVRTAGLEAGQPPTFLGSAVKEGMLRANFMGVTRACFVALKRGLVAAGYKVMEQ